MGSYGFFVKFKARDGKRDELADILLQASKSISALKECRQYIIYKDAMDNNLLFVSEIWDTKEDHDRSLTNQGGKELITKAVGLLDGRPEATELEIVGGISSFSLE